MIKDHNRLLQQMITPIISHFFGNLQGLRVYHALLMVGSVRIWGELGQFTMNVRGSYL